MWKRILLLIIVAFLAPKIYKFVAFMGFHKTVYNHAPGPCRFIDGIENGSEDIQLLPGGKALITSGLRFPHEDNPYFSDYVGQVFIVDMNQPDKKAEVVKISGNVDPVKFNPHGLSAWVSKDTGLITVFVINHIKELSVVEKFHFDPKTTTLIHLETIGADDKVFRVLNDLVAVSETEFYFTNYVHHGQFEMYLQLYWGSLGFFNGKSSNYAATGLLLPNGVNISPDGRYLYAINIGETEVRVYERSDDNSLTFKSATNLYTAPDNINVDPDTGDLWLGCHPVVWRTMKYLANPTVVSPSQVLRLRMKDGEVSDVRETLINDGSLISGSASALYYNGRLAVGTVSSKAIICEAKYV